MNDGVIDVDIDEASEPRLKKTRCDPGCRMVAAGGSRSDSTVPIAGFPKPPRTFYGLLRSSHSIVLPFLPHRHIVDRNEADVQKSPR